MKRKADIDARVAAELGLSIAEVADITTAFLEGLRDHLSDLETVQLYGLGRFRVKVSPGPDEPHELLMAKATGSKKARKTPQLLHTHRKVRVHFSKAEPLDRLIRAKHGPGSEKKS